MISVSLRRWAGLLLACLMVLASNSRAGAQFENTTIESQKVSVGGGQTVYQVKGTTTAKTPQLASSVSYKFEFQSQNELGEWNTKITVEGTKIPAAGTASIDTGWINFNPQKGEQWRGLVTGFYILNGQRTDLTSGLSAAITPIP